jgi:hypothetical protein
VLTPAVEGIDRVSDGNDDHCRSIASFPPQDPARAGQKAAVRFFWAVQILATGASFADNMTHAVLDSPHDAVTIAAAAALVPPMELLGATHSVALLVRTRAGEVVARAQGAG